MLINADPCNFISPYYYDLKICHHKNDILGFTLELPVATKKNKTNKENVLSSLKFAFILIP